MRENSAHPLLERLTRARQAPRVAQVAAGFTLPLHALNLLRKHPRLWPMLIVPALINIVVFVLTAVYLGTHAGGWFDYLWQKPDGAAFVDLLMVGVWYVLFVLALVAGVLVAYVFVLFASSIIASPFHDSLSEHAERILLARTEVETPPLGFVGATLRSLASTVTIALAYALLMGPILLMNLIPGVGSALAMVLGALVSAYFLGLEYSDPLLERRSLKMGAKFQLIRDNFWLAGSFGFATSLCMWVPLLNFVAMPLAVVGGTALGAALLAPVPAMASDESGSKGAQ